MRLALLATAVAWALAACVGALIAPSARAAESLAIHSWEAGTCAEDNPPALECNYKSSEANHAIAYQQASGHPKYGITRFEVESEPVTVGGIEVAKKPKAAVKSLRVDVPPGLASNPQTLEGKKCQLAQFDKDECPLETKIGTNEVIVYVPELNLDLPLEGSVYNLEPEAGIPLEFGIHVEGHEGGSVINEHGLLKGYVSWYREPGMEAAGVASGDYHEYFEIAGISGKDPLLMSRLRFEGNAKGPGFITLPSECPGSDTTHLRLESQEGRVAEAFTKAPLPTIGCANMPFAPLAETSPLAQAEGGTAQPDAPDATAVTAKLPQNHAASEIDSADPRQVTITMPEGLTLNPSSANGLEACTERQFGIAPESGTPTHPPIIEQEGGKPRPIDCPAGSRVGSFEIVTPDLPEPLPGSIYIGAPLSTNPASGQEYRVFLAVESGRYGVGTRLVGDVSADPSTGRLSTTVRTPQLPYLESIVHLTGVHVPPLANPLPCGQPPTESLFIPYGEESEGHLVPSPATFSAPFAVPGCPGPPPFNVAQTTADTPSTAGESTTFTLSLMREDGQQYLSGVKTTMPEGLVGSIASVPHLCEEPQAASGACPPESQIGTVRSLSGSGPTPLELPAAGEPPGPVYLTGPYAGAPYGLVIVVPAEHVGPYDYGRVVTRAGIEVDPYTTRVTTTSAVPTIVGGAPVRLRSVTVSIDRKGFMLNPTSCSPLKTESVLTGTDTLPAVPSASAHVSSPFQASDCSALHFAPHFAAITSAKTSRLDGASLEVSLTRAAHEANIREVATTLPVQLPSRDTTLQKACPEATAAANILSCPPLSHVGTATLTTPLLPGTLSGPAILVSQGGEFPDLDYVLQGDGLTFIEVGLTRIKNGITTTTYPSLPDAPFTSFHVTFPTGPNSLLAANGSFCARSAVKGLHLRSKRHRKRGLHRRGAKRGRGHGARRHGRTAAALGAARRKAARRIRGKYRRARSRRRGRHRSTRTRTSTPVTLSMPTTIVAYNGARISQNTKIAVSGCAASGVHAAHVLKPKVRVRGHRALITALVPSAGMLHASGADVKRAHRRASHAGKLTITVPLSPRGLRRLRHHRRLRTRITLRFTSASAQSARVLARTSVVFKRR